MKKLMVSNKTTKIIKLQVEVKLQKLLSYKLRSVRGREREGEGERER